MSVSYDQQITCSLDTGTETDIYRFSGTKNDRVLIEADLASSSGNFNPMIKLIAPDGSPVTGNSYSPARIDTTLPQTGTYTVMVSDQNFKYTGGYNFVVSCTGGTCTPSPPPVEDTQCYVTCNPKPTNMFTQYGTQVNCNISSPGTETDIYRFSGTKNDRVLVEMDLASSSGNNFNPMIKLIAPDGSPVTGNSYSPARIDTTLPQTGTYTVMVSDQNFKYTGGYNFVVSCTGGTCLPTGNATCSEPTLSSDLKIHIPVLNFQTQGGSVPFWADLTYQPDSSGNILFKLYNYGAVNYYY